VKKESNEQSKSGLDELRPPSPLLLAMEGRAVFEWAAFAATWPLLRQAPRGDGHPVLVLPGLMANDASTWPLRKFLERCGYAVHPWELGFNVGPRDGLIRGLTARVRAIEKQHGRKLSLVGWSLGGAMARALAVTMPEKLRMVITLGSPLEGSPKATNAWRIFELASGMKSDDPRLRAMMQKKSKVPHTAILSKSDGIVNWRMSVAPESSRSESIEVIASHFGLGMNPAVLWAVADRLAQAEGTWSAFDRSGWRSWLYRNPHATRDDTALAKPGRMTRKADFSRAP
jgi:pimeloyl-ACP methyl ester carboxylesterase